MKKFARVTIVLTLVLIFSMALAAPAFAGTADSTYYYTGILTTTEKYAVTGKATGTVIVMYPTNNKYYVGSAAEQLVIDGTVSIVCVPGVGSSSIGAAAMAKQIAKAKNVPVAAITAGLGDTTSYYYGTEGYFIGRTNNVAGTYYSNLASAKLIDLYEAGARPTMLVGHSKGNMDIANALFYLYNNGDMSLYNGVVFKTFGCGVYAPAGVNLYQYIGTLDSLGYTNTVNWSNMTYVYGRYHTLNKAYLYTYMPIQNYV